MKQELVIINKEKIYKKDNNFFCDNVDMKSIPEGLSKNFEALVIARKSNIKKFHKINLKNIKKNDLIFWKGHIAIVISKKKLIHAYGPLKKILIMPIRKTIDRIYKTANLKVIGVRRVG